MEGRIRLAHVVPVGGAPGVVDGVVGFVDVHEGAVAEAAGLGDIFGAVEVVMGAVEKLIGFAEAVAPAEAGVDGRVFAEVFAVVEGGALDFIDGGVDFCDGVVVFATDVGILPAFREQGAGVTEVAECVEVGRVRARYLLRVCSGRQKGDGCGEEEE